ncbi:MobQ family relaxase [Acinetobacter baumannii]|uniref:MobQ family relaxase n=1 Tax=Acinetobacter baumannii TaxID=470 RepID=UPI001D17DE06|nr:MobQ family relaxase [Acinetobacter baumannii]
MAIYHFSVKAISRSDGRSAVACAAYRSAEKLVCDYYGKEQDYTKKTGVEFTNIYAPENTKKELLDRQKLWNAVEKVENRKNSLLAREFEIAFPSELNAEQRKTLLDELCQELVKKHGVIVDAAIHAPHTEGGSDDRNYHAHIMFTTRSINKNGTFEAKKYRDFSRDNGTETVSNWRENFADLVNAQLEKIGSTERVSHLSYADLGSDLEATQHEGYAVTQLRRQGIKTEVSQSNDEIKQRNAEKTVNEQAITGLDQEIIASESILSDLQRSKAKSDAEHAQQQQIALERKRERLEAQSLADAHKRATDFHTAFDPNHPDKSLVTQYITDYALLARHGKQPQPPAPVEQPQPTWWQRMTGQQPQQIEQPPFFEIEVVKATAQAIVEHEKKQAQQQKWQRLQEFLQYSPSTVDRLERDAISRSFDKGQQAGDEELAEFIKYHRQNWQEKEQAAKDWQAEHDRFMREEAAKAREEAALTRQRERESEAKLEAYRERKALLDKEIAEMQQKPVNRDNEPKPRPKNDFEI